MSSPDPSPLRRGVLPNLKYDVPAGLVVFLVALPLCLGIALASGAPLLSGLLTGALAGLLVAPISGSQLSVSGPAAGLTVILLGGIAALGGFEHVLLATILAGGLQLLAGVARLGFVANLVPHAVVEGMLAGIGVILVLQQLPVALGRPSGALAYDQLWMFGHQAESVAKIAEAVASPGLGPTLVGAAALAVLLLWQLRPIASSWVGRFLPGPLVAVVVGVVVAEVLNLIGGGLALTPAVHNVAIPIPETPLALVDALPRPSFEKLGSPDLWVLAVTLAAVASLESLLSVEAVDKIDPYHRTSGASRELIAQGVGNMVAGAVGGIPMTSVIVRSSANVYAGGRTWVAAFVHGLMILLAVVAMPVLLNRIPLAALAAVLIVVGYRLARIGLFRSMARHGIEQFLPFVVTFVVTVYIDLLAGVAVGAVTGVLLLLWSQVSTALHCEEHEGTWHVIFDKDMSFLAKTRLRRALATIPDGAKVVFDGRRASFIDRDVLDMLHSFEISAAYRGITVERVGLESLRLSWLGRPKADEGRGEG